MALFDLFHGYTKRTRDQLREGLDIHGLAQAPMDMFLRR
jgi:hypothetical protein